MNKPQRIKIETPIGNIESDSGNHFVDVMTAIGTMLAIMVLKKIISKYVK